MIGPNPNLLHVIAIVADHETSRRPLHMVSDLDTMDLNHFLAVACDWGMIERLGPGRYRLTQAGIDWSTPAVLVLDVLHQRVRAAAPQQKKAIA